MHKDITWADVERATGGEMVGGQLLAFINGERTLLGERRGGGQFDYTPAGLEIAEGLYEAARQAMLEPLDEPETAVPVTRPRRAAKPKPVAEGPVAEDPPEIEA